MSDEDFVPPDFVVPARLETELFTLEALGPGHNEGDYEAWMSSKEHIHTTPGWHDSTWPRAMTLDENREDLKRHADDFRQRTGFTYTVLDRPNGDIVGCVYITRFGTASTTRACSRGCGPVAPTWTFRCGAASATGSPRSGRSAASSTPSGPARRP